MPTTSGRRADGCTILAAAALAALAASAPAQEAPELLPADAPARFETPLTLVEMTAKHAVVETGRGAAIIDLLPEAAPNHVGDFMTSADGGVTTRDRPAAQPAPFAEATVAELAAYRAVLATTSGAITIEFMPELAPEHVRNFLRLASVGVFDGMTFHRVVEGMLVQSGWLGSRGRPLDERQQRVVATLQPEFSETPHVRGIVSMARGDDPASADTSFFICTGTVSALDGEYTVFGRVVDGMATVDAIASLPLDGETPTQRVEILGVQIAQ